MQQSVRVWRRGESVTWSQCNRCGAFGQSFSARLVGSDCSWGVVEVAEMPRRRCKRDTEDAGNGRTVIAWSV